MMEFQNKPKLPVRKLRAWLKVHQAWSHEDWIELLAELRLKGYGGLTDNPEGQGVIGRFLEANRVR